MAISFCINFVIGKVEGIVGTYIANQRVPGSRYGASVISYDKGGEWTYLIPPAVDNLNQPIICAPVSHVTNNDVIIISRLLFLVSRTVLFICTWRAIESMDISPSCLRTRLWGCLWRWVTWALLSQPVEGT